MTMRRPYALGVILALALAAVARGSEPAQSFLDGLRERNYFDVALDYLDSVANNPSVSDAFKQTLLYEKGVTLVQGANQQRDSALREQQLDEAQKILQQFITAQPTHLLSASARSQLGNVMVGRARNRVEKAKKAAPAEKETLHKQARGMYDEAGKVFATLVEELRAKLKTYPAALDEKKEAKRVEERDQYRKDFLQAQLLVAATREEMADTLEKGSKDWTAALTAAADLYKKVYEDYRTRIAGLYARMYQGRCLQKLSKHKEASAFFNELLANPDTPEFRALRIKVMALAVESWMVQQLYPEILDRPVKLLESARPSEERSDEMMGLRYTIAKACKAYADQLKVKNARDPQVRRLINDGRKYLTYVTRFPNDYQEAARRLIPEFSSGDAEVSQRPEPKIFADARAAAKETIDTLQTANLIVKTLPSRIVTFKSPEKEEKQKELEQAKHDAGKAQVDAMHYCRLALKLADHDTDINDLNLIRYLLCYLLYNEGNYYDALVIGEFLAKRYPDIQGARQCAKIAMACSLRLYADAPENEKDFESRHVTAIADYIVKKWPDQPESDEALNTLIPFMIREKKLDQAQQYLEKIPVDSPQRGTAELKMGQALWANYLENSKDLRNWESGTEPAPDGVDLPARKQEIEQLKTKAKETLNNGVERMRKTGEVSKVLATAVLSLSQIDVDTNESGKAIELLEDPKIGVLSLVEKNDPAVQDEGIAEETYKTALRAYISSLAAGAKPKETIDKARHMMDELKKRMGEHPQGQQKLVQIYVSLARDLQRQMEIAEPSAKKALGVGFETFLKEVAADATELNILNWVGETYRGMGESFGTGLKSLTPEAKGYFTKAAEIFQKILDKGKNDAGFLPAAMATHVRIQLAKAYKGTGDYIKAGDIYESILKVSPMLLPVQVEGARLYQDWGAGGKGQQDNYLKAILGARPDKAKNNKNTIWGWGEIARMTTGKPEFKDQFHEARYNLALCRYQFATAQTDAAKKKEQLLRAKNDIALTAGLYPDLGGDTWKKQYDSLLKNIQKALGEQTDGLRGLETPSKAPSSGAGKTTAVSAVAPAKK